MRADRDEADDGGPGPDAALPDVGFAITRLELEAVLHRLVQVEQEARRGNERIVEDVALTGLEAGAGERLAGGGDQPRALVQVYGSVR